MRCNSCGGTVPNPLLGSNIKIGQGTLTADITSGGVKAGGSCLAMTAGCTHCYAQALEMFRKNVAASHDRNFEVLKRSPQEYARLAISEIEEFTRKKKKPPSLVRIHGFGDFYNTEHVNAWTTIATHFPKIRFFGTTRTWRVAASRTGTWAGIGDARAYTAALDRFRHLPNVFLGASLDHSTRNAKLPAHMGSGTWLQWLRAGGWSIWNMLSEFSNAATREAAGVNVKTGSAEKQHVASRGQFAAAKKMGIFLGDGLAANGCPEQAGTKSSCEVCRHCSRKGIEVSFAYHTGSSKTADDSTDVNPGKESMVIMPSEPTVAATRSNPRKQRSMSMTCRYCKKTPDACRCGEEPRAGDASFGHIYSDPSCVCARCEKRRAEGLEVGGHKAACRCVRCAARRKTWGTNPRRNPGGNARELYQGQEKDGHAPGVPTSYKVEVIADNSGQWATNAMRYATWHEARDAGSSLFGRWTAVQRWRVTGTDDPVYPETKSNPGRCSWCGISGQPLVQTGGNVMLCKPCDRLATKAQNRDVSANARLAATMTLQGRAGLHGRSSTTGKRQKPNPPRYSEGDVVRLEQTDFYSGLQAGSLGVVIAIPPGTPGSPYTDPMKKLLAVYWYGGRSEGVPKGLVRRLGKVRPSRRAALPRFATYSQERAVLVKSIRDGFNEWVVRGLQRTESRR